jgi:hypothetical protein
MSSIDECCELALAQFDEIVDLLPADTFTWSKSWETPEIEVFTLAKMILITSRLMTGTWTRR